MRFRDRRDAGRLLAERLGPLRGQDVVVLGLPRGGVPVAAEVARALGAPLDVIVVRKLGVPSQPELAMGAVGEGGALRGQRRVAAPGCDVTERARAGRARERAELESRAARFRGGRRRVPLTGRTAVVVDDGIATGSTARAACAVARALGAARVVLAVPVVRPRRPRAVLAADVDELVCLETPRGLHRGRPVLRGLPRRPRTTRWSALLDAARRRRQPATAPRRAGRPPHGDEEVRGDAPAGVAARRPPAPCPGTAPGWWSSPTAAAAAGTARATGTSPTSCSRPGSARCCSTCSPRARRRDRRQRLRHRPARRAAARVTAWLRDAARLPRRCRSGYFGASTGAGAALWAAAEPGAVAPRSSPAAAGPTSPAPRLARGAGADPADRRRPGRRVLELNRRAQARLRCQTAAGRRAGRHPPVRGARHARGGRRAGPRLVRRPPRPAPQAIPQPQR